MAITHSAFIPPYYLVQARARHDHATDGYITFPLRNKSLIFQSIALFVFDLTALAYIPKYIHTVLALDVHHDPLEQLWQLLEVQNIVAS